MLRRTTRYLLTCVLLTLTLTSCMEEDRDPTGAGVGQYERTQSIDALNLVLVTNGEGVARLVGTLLNEGEEVDRLVGMDIDTEIGDFSVIVADAPVELAPDEPVKLARDAQVTVLSDALRPGYRAELLLVFRNSEPIATTVLVERQEGIYEDVEVMEPPDGDIAPE